MSNFTRVYRSLLEAACSLVTAGAIETRLAKADRALHGVAEDDLSNHPDLLERLRDVRGLLADSVARAPDPMIAAASEAVEESEKVASSLFNLYLDAAKIYHYEQFRR